MSTKRRPLPKTSELAGYRGRVSKLKMKETAEVTTTRKVSKQGNAALEDMIIRIQIKMSKLCIKNH
jgi:hypothetical protein